MKALVVALHPPAHGDRAAFQWALVEAFADAAPLSAGTAPLQQLPTGYPVVLVVPAQALSWHRVGLPRIATARLRQALVGLLEEQLLDAPERVHFAVSPGAKGGQPAWVCVCERAWLTEQITRFEVAGQALVRIVPEFEPLPSQTQQAEPETATRFSIIGEHAEQATVVKIDAQAVLALPLEDALPYWRSEAAQSSAVVEAEPAIASAAQRWAGRSLELSTPAQRLQRAALSAWNLAQFDVVVHAGKPAWARLPLAIGRWWQDPRWRAMRYALVALVMVQLIALNVTAWQARARLADARQAQTDTLVRAFPEVQPIIDAPLQMQRALDQLEMRAGVLRPGDAVALLQVLNESLPEPGRLQSLEYDSDTLSVTLQGTSADEVARVLQSKGWSARVEGDRLSLSAGAGL